VGSARPVSTQLHERSIVVKPKKPTPATGEPSEPGIRIVKSFRHWRSGKIIRAEDYGIKGFPLGSGSKKCKKG
jgi:hypothetical protein